MFTVRPNCTVLCQDWTQRPSFGALCALLSTADGRRVETRAGPTVNILRTVDGIHGRALVPEDVVHDPERSHVAARLQPDVLCAR